MPRADVPFLSLTTPWVPHPLRHARFAFDLQVLTVDAKGGSDKPFDLYRFRFSQGVIPVAAPSPLLF